MILRQRLWAAAFVIVSFAGICTPVLAEEHIVKMLNTNGKGKFMLFDPEVVIAVPGDTVRFVPTHKGHNAEAIPKVWPEGAPEFKGAINEEIVLTVEKPGIYGIKCRPHYPMGMMGLVVAGEQVNKDQLGKVKFSGGAAKRWKALMA
jgi:pseudoazurin